MNPSQFKKSYDLFVEQQNSRGVDLQLIKLKLKKHQIELPSWGFVDSGTRFGVFHQPGAARDIYEKISDASQVNQYTGGANAVALHIPWDLCDDYKALKQYARSKGMKLGGINANLFQDPDYKFGSFSHSDSKVRSKALKHVDECIEVIQKTGSKVFILWFADGTNYPGQDNFRKRRHHLLDCLGKTYRKLPAGVRMLIEYKFFEPAFYHTDIPDWGTSYAFCKQLGPKAQVLVDTGHHALGTNIEFIVSTLIDEGKLGGFHFNNRKYADDDLTVCSINPYEMFLIYNELIDGWEDKKVKLDIAFMLDQSHNIEPKIEAMIRSIINLQSVYTKALLVNRKKLAEAQANHDIMAAETELLEAYETDVRPFLAQWRLEQGLPIDPIQAFRQSGYMTRISGERG